MRRNMRHLEKRHILLLHCACMKSHLTKDWTSLNVKCGGEHSGYFSMVSSTIAHGTRAQALHSEELTSVEMI